MFSAECRFRQLHFVSRITPITIRGLPVVKYPGCTVEPAAIVPASRIMHPASVPELRLSSGCTNTDRRRLSAKDIVHSSQCGQKSRESENNHSAGDPAIDGGKCGAAQASRLCWWLPAQQLCRGSGSRSCFERQPRNSPNFMKIAVSGFADAARGAVHISWHSTSTANVLTSQGINSISPDPNLKNQARRPGQDASMAAQGRAEIRNTGTVPGTR